MNAKTLLAALAVSICISATSFGGNFSHTMSKEVLKDKIRGAWAGQVIGCTYGGPTEFKYATTIDSHIDIAWNKHIIKWWYEHSPGLYDDVYMDLTFVDVFEKEGLDADVESFAKAFAYAEYPLWHANLQARYNIRHGIMPPASGYWENNAHADDIDFQIEADYAGIMAPGMVNAATHYTDDIGHIMNYGDGWYGGVYVAAMYSLAFISDDIEYIVTEALKTIPEQSRYYKCMSDVINWHKQYPEDWHITWALANEHYGFDIGCPNGAFNAFNIDAVINSAYIIIGLLYGEKNYYRTIDISTRCGHDSDCNPASAGGILGTVLGFSGIPDYWKEPVYEVNDMNFKYTDISLNKVCEMSYGQALKVIEANGGKVRDNKVVIPVQEPQAVRFEQSFPGHMPYEDVGIKKYLSKVGDFKFNGKGVVFKFRFVTPKNYKEHGYEAQVECWLDGKLDRTVSLPTGQYIDTKELFARYNLPLEEHTVSFKWINKEDNTDILVHGALVYSDKVKHTEHCEE